MMVNSRCSHLVFYFIIKTISYDINKTSDYINEFYCVESIKEPVTKFNFNKKPDDNETVDYYSSNLNMMYNHEDGRESARKYFNLRQEYFEKASEAYKRGWGAVASYYAEMVSP
jgi:hypothetical protein